MVLLCISQLVVSCGVGNATKFQEDSRLGEVRYVGLDYVFLSVSLDVPVVG